MSTLDAAVSELVASIDDGPTVQQVAARGRQRQGRRVLIRVLVVCAVAAIAVGVAASYGHTSAEPQITVSPTTSSTTVHLPGTNSSPWCVAVAPDDVIAEASTFLNRLQYPMAGLAAHTKLVSGSEVIAATGIANPFPATSHYWEVEFVADNDSPLPHHWVGMLYTANGQHVAGPAVGDDSPSTTLPSETGHNLLSRRDFDTLPDHSSECQSGFTLPPPPTYDQTATTPSRP
jgi:hypothetical protein